MDRQDGSDAKNEEKADFQTPQGTMLIVLIYALVTIGLWGYLYLQTLRLGGALGGH
ncbi:MAG: hypothetical protein WD535_03720 [Thermaerobacterales bacterium]